MSWNAHSQVCLLSALHDKRLFLRGIPEHLGMHPKDFLYA